MRALVPHVWSFPPTGDDVRTVLIDGKPWFVAADVCHVLGIQNTTTALYTLPADWKQRLEKIKGQRGLAPSLVSEAGLYMLVNRSSKPNAVVFQRWVFEDVLPTIRKTGTYSTPEKQAETKQAPDLSPLIRQLELELAQKDAAIQALNERVLARKPEVFTVNNYAPAAKSHWLIRVAAGLLIASGLFGAGVGVQYAHDDEHGHSTPHDSPSQFRVIHQGELTTVVRVG